MSKTRSSIFWPPIVRPAICCAGYELCPLSSIVSVNRREGCGADGGGLPAWVVIRAMYAARFASMSASANFIPWSGAVDSKCLMNISLGVSMLASDRVVWCLTKEKWLSNLLRVAAETVENFFGLTLRRRGRGVACRVVTFLVPSVLTTAMGHFYAVSSCHGRIIVK